jgi:hypothetical protein
MSGTITTIDTSDRLVVLGETLRPLPTNAMGSSLEIFDTTGPADAGPPPHTHPWEEVYVALDGELGCSSTASPTGWFPVASPTSPPAFRTTTATSPRPIS